MTDQWLSLPGVKHVDLFCATRWVDWHFNGYQGLFWNLNTNFSDVFMRLHGQTRRTEPWQEITHFWAFSVDTVSRSLKNTGICSVFCKHEHKYGTRQCFLRLHHLQHPKLTTLKCWYLRRSWNIYRSLFGCDIQFFLWLIRRLKFSATHPNSAYCKIPRPEIPEQNYNSDNVPKKQKIPVRLF